MKGVIVKNPTIAGGIGAPDIDLKVISFRIMFLIKLSTYSDLKCYPYFIDRYNSLKTTGTNSTIYWAFPSLYRDLYNAEHSVGMGKDGDNLIMLGQSYSPSQINTKLVYSIITKRQSNRHVSKIQHVEGCIK